MAMPGGRPIKSAAAYNVTAAAAANGKRARIRRRSRLLHRLAMSEHE